MKTIENDLSDRQQKIICLLKESQVQTGKELAACLGISVRTLQLDIAHINQSELLITSDNRGYRLNEEALAKLHTLMLPTQNQSHRILKKLILAAKPIPIQSLSDELYISDSTLLRQLKSDSRLLSSFQLSIKRKDNRIYIEGSEFNKRRLISHLINSEIKPFMQGNYDPEGYFSDIDVTQMRNLVLRLIHHYNCLVDEPYFSNMLLNLMIAFHRMKTGFYMELSSDIHIGEEDVAYQIAKELCAFYTTLWRVEPSKEDISYIAIILLGQIKPLLTDDPMEQNNIISEQFLNQMDEILMETFHYFMLDIDYKEQLYGFALHINALLKRSRYQQEVTNDLLESVRLNSPFIYDVAVLVAEKIAECFHIHVLEQEIGYIAIHIGFLIENTSQRNAKERTQVNVLLISSDYYQIEANISAHLQTQFHERIHILIGKSMNDPLLFNQNVDVLITTQPMHIIGKQTVVISPFYTPADEFKVNEVILQVMKEKEKNLSYQLLISYFHENLFINSDTITTREEAIEFLGQKIIDFGLENDTFISSVKKREALSSTCFFEKFAIPHALKMNAKKTMFCVLINEKGIEWEEGKIIPIVVMLSVCHENRKEFMKIYNGIITALCDKEKLSRIVKTKTFFEFLQQFKE